jgi:hypothetical protein
VTAQTLPLNARLFASLPGVPLDKVTLVDANGALVPTAVTPAGGAPHHVWIQPMTPLQPSTRYRLVARLDSGEQTLSQGDHYLTSKFEKENGLDRKPPYLSGVELHPGGLASQCEVDNHLLSAYLITATASDDNGGANATVQVDVSDGTRSDTLFFCGSHYGLDSDGTFGFSSPAPSPDCPNDRRLSFGETGKTYSARVTAWDWGGNSTVVGGIQFTLGRPEVPKQDGGPMADGSVAPSPGGGPDAGAVTVGDARAGQALKPDSAIDPSAMRTGSGCSLGPPGGSAGWRPALVLLALACLLRRKRGRLPGTDAKAVCRARRPRYGGPLRWDCRRVAAPAPAAKRCDSLQ